MSTFKVGITRDALGADGKPVFDPAALKIFDAEPSIQWEFLPELSKELSAAYGAA